MEPSPLFSILIANYNNGIYLEDAINSIMKQTYQNWEIIIVDDCSTDNSLELYKKYESDSRIHVYYNDSNHGCGYTKRRCAELAHGEICGFVDPDDTLEPDALETMIKAHAEDDSLSLVYSRYNEVDENLQFIRVSKQQRPIPEGSSFLEGDGGGVTLDPGWHSSKGGTHIRVPPVHQSVPVYVEVVTSSPVTSLIVDVPSPQFSDVTQ